MCLPAGGGTVHILRGGRGKESTMRATTRLLIGGWLVRRALSLRDERAAPSHRPGATTARHTVGARRIAAGD